MEAEKADLRQSLKTLNNVDSGMFRLIYFYGLSAVSIHHNLLLLMHCLELQSALKQLEDNKISVQNAHNQTRRTLEEMGKAQKGQREAEIRIGQMEHEREEILKQLKMLDVEITSTYEPAKLLKRFWNLVD